MQAGPLPLLCALKERSTPRTDAERLNVTPRRNTRSFSKPDSLHGDGGDCVNEGSDGYRYAVCLDQTRPAPMARASRAVDRVIPRSRKTAPP